MMQMFVPRWTTDISVCIDCGDTLEEAMLMAEPSSVLCGRCAETAWPESRRVGQPSRR
jgi:hypothetical protein